MDCLFFLASYLLYVFDVMKIQPRKVGMKKPREDYMKVLGMSYGRKMSNTEILVKEALMGAKEAGADIEFIRMQDMHIKPCTGCNACVVSLFEKAGSGECILKGDDFAFVDDKILEADGLIVGAPIYEKMVPGQMKNMCDRQGPGHDIAFRMIAKQIRAEKGITEGKGPDERSFKQRAASLIAVGGSEWDNLALPMMHLSTVSMNIQVVDKMLFNWVALPGMVALHDEKLSRAYQSGQNVVEALKGKVEEAEYKGDKGVCPLCHSKLFEIRNAENGQLAVCAVCGVKGNLECSDHDVSFEIPPEEMALAHVKLSGKFHHAQELKEVSLVPHPEAAKLPEKMTKYKDFIEASRPE